MGRLSAIREFARKHEAVVIFFLLCAVYLSNCFYYMSSTDTIPAILLPFSVLDQHNVFFDQFVGYYQGSSNWWGTYFFREAQGHVLSSYPIVAPLLVTPLYVIPYVAIKLIGIPVAMSDGRFFLLAYAMEKISAAVIAALASVVFYKVLREMFDRKVSLLGLFIFALATSTWTIGSQGLWQHGMSELLLCLIMLVVARNIKSPKTRNFAFLGILSSLLVFNRPTNALVVLPVFAYLLLNKWNRWRSAAAYALSAGAVALPFVAYNLIYFNGIFGGYGELTSLFSLDGAPYRLAGLLISPSRGLFIYTPIALLAFAGALYVKDIKEPELRKVIYAFGLVALAILGMYACYEFWWGGGCYGPRFFTDIIPIVVLFVTAFAAHVLGNGKGKYYKVAVALIGILLLASLLVQVIGAYFYPVYGFQWGHGQQITFDDQSKLWDWKDTQLSESMDWLVNSSNHGYHYNFNGSSVSVSKG